MSAAGDRGRSLVRSESARDRSASGAGAEVGEVGADVFGAAGIGHVPEQALVELDRDRRLARELLGAGLGAQRLLVHEVLRAQPLDEALIGLSGAGVVLL